MGLGNLLEASAKAVEGAARDVKPIIITHKAPSGRVYEYKWKKPGKPSKADIQWTLDDAQRQEAQRSGEAPVSPPIGAEPSSPNPRPQGLIGGAISSAVEAARRGVRPKPTHEITSYDPAKHGGIQSPEQQQSSDAKAESDYLFHLSDKKLGELIEGTYDNKRPPVITGRSIPEIREKLLTERQRRLGQVGEYALPPGLRQVVALGLNFPEQIRASMANIGHPEASVGDTIAGAADIVPIPIAGELVEFGLKGLGKLGGKIVNALKGRKFASKAEVDKFLEKQGLTRDQVTMVMRTADKGSVATAPKMGVPEGAKAGINIRQAAPKVVSPFRPKEPRSSTVFGGPNEVLQERIGREAANIRAANPDMPEDEVSRLATIYAKKKLEDTNATQARKVEQGGQPKRPQANAGGKAAETGGSNRPPESGQVPKDSQEVEDVTGIRMQDLEEASRKLGIKLPDKSNFKEHWSTVEARALGEFDRIAKSIERVNITKNPALTRDEHYVGNVELRRLGGEISDLSEKLGKATNRADKEALQIQLDDRLAQAERLSRLLYRSNSEHGRNLAFLRFTLDGPFDAAGLTAKAERLAGGNLNSDVRVTLNNLASKGQKAQLTLEEKMRSEAKKALKAILEHKPKITARGVRGC